MRRDELESMYPPHPVEPLRWWERVIAVLGIVAMFLVGAFIVCAYMSGWAS